jgi:hypothetical protein
MLNNFGTTQVLEWHICELNFEVTWFASQGSKQWKTLSSQNDNIYFGWLMGWFHWCVLDIILFTTPPFMCGIRTLANNGES